MIAGIQLDEKSGFFIHFNFGTYMTEKEANDSILKLKGKKDWWGASISLSYKNR